MIIHTDRLALRHFTIADADDLFAIFSRPEVARWSGAGTPMAHRDEAVTRIERMPGRAGEHPAAGIFAIMPDVDQRVVGMVMLVPLPSSADVDRHVHEIGWHLHPDVWGRGYATEAARALIDRAWVAGLAELHAVTHPDNVASQAVCARLGMTDLGVTSDAYDLQLRAFRLDRT